MSCRQWDVVLASLDPVEGSEQGGTRPVLVVSIDEFNENLPNVTVIPLSGTSRDLYPSEVVMPAGTTGPQGRNSIAMAHQIRTISQRRIGKVLGQLKDEKLRKDVLDAIFDHLGYEVSP